MATTPPVIQAKITTSEAVKVPFIPLLTAVAIGVIVATSSIAGVMYYLLRSGKIPIQDKSAVATAPIKTHIVALEPLLVNLADSSGAAYLRIGITLQVAENENEKETKTPEANASSRQMEIAVRDTALVILGRQTSEQLLALQGKERLKENLKAALAKRNPDLKITDLFFTEFLVQR